MSMTIDQKAAILEEHCQIVLHDGDVLEVLEVGVCALSGVKSGIWMDASKWTRTELFNWLGY